MSEFDPNYKRLKIIISLFVFLSIMYALEWACFVWYQSPSQETPMYIIDTETMEKIDITEEYYKNESRSQELGGSDFNFFGFMTFTLEEIPDWQKTIFTPLSIIIWIIGIYLIIDWVYAWIKALPFT